MLVPVFVSARQVFTIEGPEEDYNQIRVENGTSQVNFRCRIVILDNDDSVLTTYGVFELKEKGDSDSNTSRIPRGTRIGIDMPKDFPVQVSYFIEYRDYPLFDAVIIHLTDETTEFE